MATNVCDVIISTEGTLDMVKYITNGAVESVTVDFRLNYTNL